MSTHMFRRFMSNVALETIDFQKDGFGKQLEAVLQDLKADLKSGVLTDPASVQNSKYTKILTDMIKKRFGLTVELLLNTKELAYASPVLMNNRHIFTQDWITKHNPAVYDDNYEELRTNIEKGTGTVDLKRAVVGGLFSELKQTVGLNVRQMCLEYDFEPGHTTGILLHEIGHLFTYFEYSDRLTRTNLVMLDVTEKMLSKDNKNSNYIYSEISKITEVDKKQIEDMCGNNRLVAGVKLATVLIGALGSSMQTNKYNETAAEQSADAFASRMGYGRQLIESLEILHKKDAGSVYYGTTQERLGIQLMLIYTSENFWSAVSVIAAGIVAALALPGAFGLTVMSAMGAVALLVLARAEGISGINYRYDELKDRYIRIRQQFIQGIKSEDMPAEELKRYIDDVETVDKIIASVKPFEGILTKLASLVFSKDKADTQDIKFQRLLEDLTNNDLFLMAAKFKTQA